MRADFWNNLEKYRGSHSLKECADFAGIEYQSFYNQKNLNRMPKIEALIKLADALGVGVDCLILGYPAIKPDYSSIQDIIDKVSALDDSDLALIRGLLKKF